MKIQRSLLLLFLTLLPLAACASSKDASATLDCPQVAFVGDAADITQFASTDSTAPNNMTSQASFLGFQGGCSHQGNSVKVDLNVALKAQKGPALTQDYVTYRYFIAIADPAKTILAKQEFDTKITFPKDSKEAGVQEDLSQTIPLAEGAKAQDYHILIGFQLSPEEIAYNRNHKHPL